MSDAPSPLSRQRSVGNCASMRFRRIAPLNSSPSAAASNPAATASAVGCSDGRLIRTQSVPTTSSGGIRSRPASPLMTGGNGGLRSSRATPCRSPETTSEAGSRRRRSAVITAAPRAITAPGNHQDKRGLVTGGSRTTKPVAEAGAHSIVPNIARPGHPAGAATLTIIGGQIERIRHLAEIDVEIFRANTPVRAEHPFDAAASGPSRLEIGECGGGRIFPEALGAPLGETIHTYRRLDVGKGDAAGAIHHQTIECLADTRADGADRSCLAADVGKPITIIATSGASYIRLPAERITRTSPLPVALDAQHPCGRKLPIIPGMEAPGECTRGRRLSLSVVCKRRI